MPIRLCPPSRLPIRLMLLAGCALVPGAVVAGAQTAPAPAPAKEIVVSAHALPGSVASEVPQAPIATFDEADIAAYGVTSIADLLDALAPETGSGRGRGSGGPIILVNGVRIASFRELRDYPPEAIRRVEILPEEVSLRYGFAPDQRVVNFILKDHFNARTLENEDTTPQQGGGSFYDQFKASLLNINYGKRLNIALETDHTTPLTEARRGVIQTPGSVPTVAGEPNPADSRDLVADSSDYSLNATWTLPVGVGANSGTLALNAAASRADSTNLAGLNTLCTLAGAVVPCANAPDTINTFAGALASITRTDTLQSGASLNKPLGNWQLSATVDGTHAVTTTTTDNPASITAMQAALASGSGLPDAGASIAQATSNSATSLVTLVGYPLQLPGGKLSMTVKAGFAWSEQVSSGGMAGGLTLRRGDASTGINLGIPVTSRKLGFGGAVGDITLNFSAGLDKISDAGTLTNWSGGVTWGVTDALNLQASYIFNQAAPSLSNLGNPAITSLNVPVYDFATGKTVLATTIGGGNPALLNEGEHDIKLGLNWSLPFIENSNLIVEYFNNRSTNVAAGFPLLTPEVEQAFGRVTRDANGNIVSINETPVNLASQQETRLRWGFNLFGNIGKALPPVRGGRFGGMMGGGGGPPGGGDPGGPPGGGGPGGPSGGGWHGEGHGGHGGGGNARKRYPGRWNVAVYHTVQFIDRVTLAPGFAPLNLLGGDALGSSGGVARQSLQIDAGGFYKGFGVRLGGTWTGPTHVNPLDAPVTSDLRFGALTKFNLRAFIDFGQQAALVKAVPFFKGARLSLMANNIFDSRQKVTDGTGATPLAYQPFVVDPLGRVFGLELRKLF